MIDNREMAEFAENLWDNYIKFRHSEANQDTVSFYKATVTVNNEDGVLGIQRPFDTETYYVSCPSYMEEVTVGQQVLVLRFGEGTNLTNHFVIDNAARTMLASAIASGSSITFPISIANGGTGATSLAGAKTALEIPSASDASPNMDGTASAGSLSTFSRGDHTHPSDTSKADVSATVSNVSYDSANNKIQQTINGTTTDVVTLSEVAVSGSYNDLAGKPTIPSYSLSMASNVITLTGTDGNITSVTLPVWDGSYTVIP